VSFNAIAVAATPQCCELQHHRCYSVVNKNAAIVATLVHSTSVRLLLNSCRPFIWLSLDDSFKFRSSNFCPSRDFRSTFVELSSTFVHLETFVRRSSNFHPTPCHAPSFARLSYILLSCILFCRPNFSFDICLTFVRPSLDVRLTSVRHLCVMGHSQ